MSMHIVEDKQRRDRPHPASGWPFGSVPFRVPAARGHLLCWRSSTMHTDIASSRRLASFPAALGAAHCTFTTGC